MAKYGDIHRMLKDTFPDLQARASGETQLFFTKIQLFLSLKLLYCMIRHLFMVIDFLFFRIQTPLLHLLAIPTTLHVEHQHRAATRNSLARALTNLENRLLRSDLALGGYRRRGHRPMLLFL